MSDSFQNGDLRLEVREDAAGATIAWHGRSTARDPATFLAPILTDLYRRMAPGGKAVMMDFRKLEYMNSSTITPIIRLLHEAKKGTGRVTITYDAASRWQDLSFSALTVFQTEDKRIEIRGA